MLNQRGSEILRFNFIFLIHMALTLTGCASVPRESVELSKEVGKGIAESQRAYTDLVNIYFASKRQQIDQWIENEYLPEYLSNIQTELQKAGRSLSLSPQQLRDVLRDVIVERDQKHTDLENTRRLLLTKSDDHYTRLSQGNAGITGLLRSMVDVKEATSSATRALDRESAGKLDLERLEKKFNDYLRTAGAASIDATNLYKTIQSAIEKKGE